MIGICDANNFYVSCERVFNPALNGRPVVVLSNNDRCIMARSNEAKTLGLKMGQPIYQIADVIRANHVVLCSSNFKLYGDMSRRMQTILKRFVPQTEVYSVDEAFLDFRGIMECRPLSKDVRWRKQLNELTGMQSVKTEINNMINLLKICKIRQENGLQTPPVTNHMVFLGNPGTGKTTVARILAKIYHGLGVLSKGHLVEVDRSGLVAGYMGQTSEKVTEVIEKAKGGILFIDEAYALANGQQGDFGQEAIDILNKAMEDNREDLIVIAAGYHDEMQDFLDANPGLRSRFNRTIEFPNYDAEELLEIMTNRAKSLDYTLTDDAVQYVQDTFTRILACPPENFGNARSVRNYLDRVIHNQANRLIAENNFKEEDLTKLTLADVQSETLE